MLSWHCGRALESWWCMAMAAMGGLILVPATATPQAAGDESMNRWTLWQLWCRSAVLQFVNACCFDIAVEYCCNMAEFSCTLRIRRGMMLAPTSHRHQGNQQTKWLNYVRRSLSWRQVEAPRSFEFDDVWQVQGFLVWAVLEALWPREVPTTAVRCKDFDMYYDAYRHL